VGEADGSFVLEIGFAVGARAVARVADTVGVGVVTSVADGVAVGDLAGYVVSGTGVGL